MISVLSVYRGTLSSDRGTAIRVRSIIKELFQRSDIVLHTATWDREQTNSFRHIFLPNKHIREIFRLISYIRKEKIEVVIGHTISSVLYAIAIRLCTPATVMLEMHGFLEEEEYLYGNIGRVRYGVKKYFYAFLYRFFDLITVCSETAREYIYTYNSNTVAVYGGFDADTFKPIPQVTSGSKLIIGYAGNARVWQGLDFLLSSLASLHDVDFELRILCSEKKWKPDPIYNRFVTLYPQVPYSEVPSFLAQCDVLVIPRLENRVNRLSFPSKLIEYMAMGKPVIASRTSDCHKIINSDVDGLLFDPGDTEGFLDNVRALIDISKRQIIGKNALCKVSSFTWDRQVAIIVDNLKDICQKKIGNKIH